MHDDHRFRILTLFLRTPVCEDLLLEHAKKEIALENIFFWRAVTTYLDMYDQESSEQRSQRESELVELYLQPGTDYEINISSTLRNDLLRNSAVVENWRIVRVEIGSMILNGQVLRLSGDVSNRVRKSWQRAVGSSNNNLMKLFYAELFQLDPSIRTLFRTRPSKQERMFAKVMGATLTVLDNFGNLFELLSDLGKKHKNYGMKPEHFAIFGDALINTLANILGEEFDEDTRKAWCFVYALLTTIMLLSMDINNVDCITLDFYRERHPFTNSGESMSSKSVLESPNKRKSAMTWMACCSSTNLDYSKK